MSDDFPLEGATAPPMANGELVFEAPWQGRAFGMARSLAEAGVYTWDEFRARLIAAIARWEQDHAGEPFGEPYRYYDRFLEALDELLRERGLLESCELDARAAALAARPHGHDHSR